MPVAEQPQATPAKEDQVRKRLLPTTITEIATETTAIATQAGILQPETTRLRTIN